MVQTETDRRLAALIQLVAEGIPIIRACSVLHVSQRTVWMRRRSPDFQAALMEAERVGELERLAVRDRLHKARVFDLALEREDKGEVGRLYSKKEKRAWYAWQGAWPRKDAGTADQLDAETREKMQRDFEERRQRKAEKRQRRQLADIPRPEPQHPYFGDVVPDSSPRPTIGKAGPLWE